MQFKRRKRTKKPHTKPVFLMEKGTVARDSKMLESPSFKEREENGAFEVPYLPSLRDKSADRMKYKSDFARVVYHLARLGARDEDIAEVFGVEPGTIQQWKKDKKKEFYQSWHEGKWMFGMEVAETLGNRALGYDYIEVEESQTVTRAGNVVPIRKVMHKHMAPDVVAGIFILKNQFKESWGDQKENQMAKMTSEIANKIDMTKFTDEEQALMKSIALKKISAIHGVSNG